MASLCVFSCVFFSVLGHLKLSPQLLQVCGLPAFMVILLVGDSMFGGLANGLNWLESMSAFTVMCLEDSFPHKVLTTYATQMD